MKGITDALQVIKLSVDALDVEAADLSQLSAQLFAVERKIVGLREFIDGVEAKKRREALAQLLLDNDFTAKDLTLLDGRAFSKNQAGKVEEIDHNNNVIALDCRDRGNDVPF